MLPVLFLAVLCIGATSSSPPEDPDVEECEPVLCYNDEDCDTPQPEVTLITESSTTTEWEESPPDSAGPCQPNPCHNGGECEATVTHRGDAFLGYLCHCPPGYAGGHCQHNVNECESGPCQNRGVCTDLEANYTCMCPGEYTGRNCQYQCSGPLGLEGGLVSSSQLSASSSLSTMFGLQAWLPQLARLNRKGLVNAWSAAESDRWPWIQVDLGRPMRVTGVITQGARFLGISQFVKSFKVAYGNNGKTWRMVKVKGSPKDRVFHGNSDNSSPVANSFSPPVEAQYIRLYPLVCRSHCTLRMELTGCELTGCLGPLGLKVGQVLDSQLSASSVYRTLGMGLLSWGPAQARLDQQGRVNAWSAAHSDQRQWIQVDLLVPSKVTGLVTQGARDFGQAQFVGSYKLSYSDDGVTWTIYQDQAQHIDKGNSDHDTHRKNYVEPPIYGRFLRLIPWSWHGRITVRMELLGCAADG